VVISFRLPSSGPSIHPLCAVQIRRLPSRNGFLATPFFYAKLARSPRNGSSRVSDRPPGLRLALRMGGRSADCRFSVLGDRVRQPRKKPAKRKLLLRAKSARRSLSRACVRAPVRAPEQGLGRTLQGGSSTGLRPSPTGSRLRPTNQVGPRLAKDRPRATERANSRQARNPTDAGGGFFPRQSRSLPTTGGTMSTATAPRRLTAIEYPQEAGA
jgi:hypothetical protein